ncbi:hypothetical protein H7347_08750 [Corynebacterium sp. zg-331]|uniref:hypothetical protein n=1 Tax=unclassified Corynebacterium TaxID=2624378 RepID=UPI00128BA72A|nr:MULTISPECIES: hypothetical protein [unclassified Corynebacterium]MBC3186652.1 hypothetical protein [Corynebacterium sp. zg-331]MPV53136.1 hypothetical protein [Corynebacterium sp. zg331]
MKHSTDALVAHVPQGWAEARGDAIVRGLCRASRLLGLSRAHLVAEASDLPALAVAAAHHGSELPAGFQLCQRGSCAQPGVLLDAAFLLRLARVEGAVAV